MKHQFPKSLFWVVIVFLLFQSCKKEATRWDADVLMPLLHLSMGVDKIFPDSLLQEDSSGQVALVFQKNIFELSVDSLVNFPDTASTLFFLTPLSGTLQPGQELLHSVSSKKFNFGGAQLSAIQIYQGSLEVDFINTINANVEVQYSLPAATKNGVIFSIHETLPSHALQSGAIHKSYDISDYLFDLTGPAHNQFNTIDVDGLIKIADTESPVAVNSFDAVYMNSLFGGMRIDFARGYFGTGTYTVGPEKTALDLFSSLPANSILFQDASLHLLVHNALGVDVRALLSKVWTENTAQQLNLPLQSAQLLHPLNISRAISNGNPQSTVIASDYRFDFSGSNLAQMISSFPDQIGYQFSMTYNPMGNASSGNDFYYKDNSFRALIELNVPLHLQVQQLVLSDTSNFSFSGGSINQATLFIDVLNGFPLDAGITLNLYDSRYHILHRLLSDNLIRAATMGADNKVLGPKESLISIPLNSLDIEQLRQTSYIGSEIRFNSVPSSVPVRFFKDYLMDIRIACKSNVNISN